ncbi:hypothetical protein MK805_17345 [Shimazuella sp. AN120528]|uniref:hypothetical protein n=1 Tax=Shimazuella soli TaxID=1892854 RepID=UPI001F0E0F3F|nr:hypothetical protein [Shimazuella soli]MCH5586701.1 hypothetical protein [Shimazuella soli]
MEMPGLGKTSAHEHMLELAALNLPVTIIDPDEYLTPRFNLPVRRFKDLDEYKEYMKSLPRSEDETLVFELREPTEAEKQAWSKMYEWLAEEWGL